MPHYEPVARKPFITPPASRTTSRKNSMHDATRPALAQESEPEVPPLPELLAETIKKLKDARDGDGERGRQREPRRPSMGGADRAEPFWDDGSRFGRREGSVSTRDKVAMWEERSRSRSMGRSKSRRRHLDDANRVSIVPEIPDLELALAQAGGPRKLSEKIEIAEEAEPLSLSSSDPPTQELAQDNDRSGIDAESMIPAAAEAQLQPTEKGVPSRDPLVEELPAKELERGEVDQPVVEALPVEESSVQQLLDEQPSVPEMLVEKILVDQLPAEALPTEDLTTKELPTLGLSAEPASAEDTLAEDTLIEEMSIGERPIEEVLVENLPIEEVSVGEIPTEEVLVDEALPVKVSLVQQSLDEKTPVPEMLVEETLVDQLPAEVLPTEDLTTEELPAVGVSVEAVSAEATAPEDTLAEDTPAEDIPVEEVSVSEAPNEELPVENLTVEEALVEQIPAEDIHMEITSVKEAPTMDQELEDLETSIKERPVEELPIEDIPVREITAKEIPVAEVSTEEVLIESVPVEDLPELEKRPVEELPVEVSPVEEVPVKETPIEETIIEAPIEKTPIEETPIEETIIEDLTLHKAPVEDVTLKEPLIEEAPIRDQALEDLPMEEMPVVPFEGTPAEAPALEDLFVKELPIDDVLAEEPPVADLALGSIYAENVSVEELPIEIAPEGGLSLQEGPVEQTSAQDHAVQQQQDLSVEELIPSEALIPGPEPVNEEDDENRYDEYGSKGTSLVLEDHLDVSIKAMKIHHSSRPVGPVELATNDIHPVAFSSSIGEPKVVPIHNLEEPHLESQGHSLQGHGANSPLRSESPTREVEDGEDIYDTDQEIQPQVSEASESGSFGHDPHGLPESVDAEDGLNDRLTNIQDTAKHDESLDGRRDVELTQEQSPSLETNAEHPAAVAWEEAPSTPAMGQSSVLSAYNNMNPPLPTQDTLDGAPTPEDAIDLQMSDRNSNSEAEATMEELKSSAVVQPVVEWPPQDLGTDEASEETVYDTAAENGTTHQELLSSAIEDVDTLQHETEYSTAPIVSIQSDAVTQSSEEMPLNSVARQPETTELPSQEPLESLDYPISEFSAVLPSPKAAELSFEEQSLGFAADDRAIASSPEPAPGSPPLRDMTSLEAKVNPNDAESFEAQMGPKKVDDVLEQAAVTGSEDNLDDLDSVATEVSSGYPEADAVQEPLQRLNKTSIDHPRDDPEVSFQVTENDSEPEDEVDPSDQPLSGTVPAADPTTLEGAEDAGSAFAEQPLVEQSLEIHTSEDVASDISTQETTGSMPEQPMEDQVATPDHMVNRELDSSSLTEMDTNRVDPDNSTTLGNLTEQSGPRLATLETSKLPPAILRLSAQEYARYDDASPASTEAFHSALATPADAVFLDTQETESVAREGHSEDSVRTDTPSSGLFNVDPLASDPTSEQPDSQVLDVHDSSVARAAESTVSDIPIEEVKSPFDNLAEREPVVAETELSSAPLLKDSIALAGSVTLPVLADSATTDQRSFASEEQSPEAIFAPAETATLILIEPEKDTFFDVGQSVTGTDIADMDSVADERVPGVLDSTSEHPAEPTIMVSAEFDERLSPLEPSTPLAKFPAAEDQERGDMTVDDENSGNGEAAPAELVNPSDSHENVDFDIGDGNPESESTPHQGIVGADSTEPINDTPQNPKARQAEGWSASEELIGHDSPATPALQVGGDHETLAPERASRDSGVQMTQEEDSDSEQSREELAPADHVPDKKVAVEETADFSSGLSEGRVDAQVIRDSGVGLIAESPHVIPKQLLQSEIQSEQSPWEESTVNPEAQSSKPRDELFLEEFDEDAASIPEITEDQLPSLLRPSTPVQRERRLLNDLPTPEATPDRIQTTSEASGQAKALSAMMVGSERGPSQLMDANRKIAVEALERPSTPPPKASFSAEFPPTPSSAPREATKARDLHESSPMSRPQEHHSRQESLASSIGASDKHVAVVMAEEVLGDLVPEPRPLLARVAPVSELEPDRGRRRTRDWAQNPPQIPLEEEVERQHTPEERPALPPRNKASQSKKPSRDMQGYHVPSDVSDDAMQMPALPPRAQKLSANAAPYEPRETPKKYPAPSSGVTGPSNFNIPPPPEPAYTNGRTSRAPSKSRSKSRRRLGGLRNLSRPRRQPWDAPPVVERAIHAAAVGVMQGFSAPMGLYRDLRNFYYPPPGHPDIVKAYEIRGRLPVRIFFPSRHDSFSQALLPTLFTIHGGAFTIGNASDDDVWNRNFADSYSTLVIALNYAKAPWAGFPCPLLDVEALYHAVLNDESLPIDKSRTALAGFDAGANLALCLAQLPSVKNGVNPTRAPYPYPQHLPYPTPKAAISICGILDFAITSGAKARTRPYKRQLRGIRGWGPGLDWMVRILPSSSWSYIPYGHDAMDPLLSPMYARRADLPPHLFVVGAELDCLAHDSWRAACTWAGRPVPASNILVGRRNPSRWRGALDDGAGENATKFAWEENGNGTGGEGSTRWLLVPDVVHGFDCDGWRKQYMWADEEGRADSEMKTFAYQRELALWLWGTVWRNARPWR